MAAVVLTAALAAVACTTNGGATRPPTTTTHGGSAAPPARDLRGLIAYSTQAGDIWVMDADESNRRQVTRTRDPAFDFDPSLSPDGRRVVFRTSRGRYVPDPNGTETIVTTDPDGTHLHHTGVVGGECAEWSPDSSRLAYCHHSGDGDFDVWVMNADGSHRRRLTAQAAGTTRAPGRPTADGWPSAPSARGTSTCT